MEYIELGTTPYDEDCVQVGSFDYAAKAVEEAKKFVALLRELFGDEQERGCLYKIKSFPHDFGSYYEVVIGYYEDSSLPAEFAYFVESNIPARWDAKKEDFPEFKESDDGNVE